MKQETGTITLTSEGYISRHNDKIKVWLHNFIANLVWKKDYPFTKDEVLDCIADAKKFTPAHLEALEFVIADYREDGCNITANYLQEIYNEIKKL